MKVSKSLRERLKSAIEVHEETFGQACWGNGRSNIRHLPNDFDGQLLEKIVQLIELEAWSDEFEKSDRQFSEELFKPKA